MPKDNRTSIVATETCTYCGRPLAVDDVQTIAAGAAEAWTHVRTDDGICPTHRMAAEIYDEWHEHHALSPAAVHWLATHGDPGDPQPIATGIELLRRLDMTGLAPEGFDQPDAG